MEEVKLLLQGTTFIPNAQYKPKRNTEPQTLQLKCMKKKKLSIIMNIKFYRFCDTK